ncbi:MAG: histone deacetylase family protein [bacterium]
MKVFFHPDFYQVYTSDPAAAAGRMESIVDTICDEVELVEPLPASETEIALVHSAAHINTVKKQGLYPIAALAAGGAIQAAHEGLTRPSFGLIRPPGHHASSGSAWGFCYFNNMAIAFETLKRQAKIKTGYILDIDMHFGDGTHHILKENSDIIVHNIETEVRDAYMQSVSDAMEICNVDLIGISAGFDNHLNDWGGVLLTRDYADIGKMVKAAARRNGSGCFGILEGGYNHQVLGASVLALIQGMCN